MKNKRVVNRDSWVVIRVLRILVWVVLGCFTLSLVAVLALRWIDPVTSTFIVHDRLADAIKHDPRFHYRRQWVDSEHIAPAMKLAVIAAEDQKFADHWGFDFDSINDAIEQHERGRRL